MELRSWRFQGSVLALVVVSVLLRVLCYAEHPPAWDAASYVLMGKSLFSGGEVGLWEPMRPLLWPILLGASWKAGLDPLAVGQVLQIVFSVVGIALVADLGRRAFDGATGLWAALLLALSPTYLTWGNELYTGIPATCLLLAAFAAAMRGRALTAGLLLALASLTRFVVILTGPVLAMLLWIGPGRMRSIARCLAGGIAILLPYALHGYVRYGNPFAPLLEARQVFSAYTPLWEQGPFYYVQFLLAHESWLLVLAPVAQVLTLRSRRWRGALLLLPAWIFLLFFSLSRTQTLRYLLPALPFLALATAAAATTLVRAARVRPYAPATLAGALVTIGLWNTIENARALHFEDRGLDVFQKTAQQFAERGGGAVWVSNPTMTVHTDLRVDEAMYYPVLDARRAQELLRSLPAADLVMISLEDLPCAPVGDAECVRAREQLLRRLEREMQTLWQARTPEGVLVAAIYLRSSPSGD